jgi:hypothetical protein
MKKSVGWPLYMSDKPGSGDGERRGKAKTLIKAYLEG